MTARIFSLAAMMAAVAGGAVASPKTMPAVAVGAPEIGRESIAYTQRKPADLSAGYDGATMQRYGNSYGLYGVVGAMIASYVMDKTVGGHITRSNELVDPGPELSRRVATAVARHRGAVVVEPGLATRAIRLRTLAREAGDARYLVDVQTMTWFVAPGGNSKTSYPSQYTANMTVLDVRTAVAVTNASCSWTSPVLKTSDGAVISGDKKSMLHAQFATAADACFEQFMTAVRGAIPAGERRDLTVATVAAPAPPAPVLIPAVFSPPPAPAAPVVARAEVQPAIATVPRPAPVIQASLPRAASPQALAPVVRAPPSPPRPTVVAQAEPPRYASPTFDHRLASAYGEPMALPGFVVRP